MDTRKPDIFDRLMHLPVLNIFEPFYKKHKEMLLYLFFGGLTFVISVITYAFFNGNERACRKHFFMDFSGFICFFYKPYLGI